MSGLFQLSWLLMAKSPCVCLQPYRVVDTGKRLGGYRSVTVAPRGTEAVLALQAFEAPAGRALRSNNTKRRTAMPAPRPSAVAPAHQPIVPVPAATARPTISAMTPK